MDLEEPLDDATREWLERELLKGLDSGPAFTAEDWARIRAAVLGPDYQPGSAEM